MFRYLSPIVFTSGKCIFPVKQYLLVVKTNRLVATSQMLSGEMWVIPTQTAHDELDLKQFKTLLCGSETLLPLWLTSYDVTVLPFVFSSFLCSSFIDSSCLLHVPFKNLHAFSIIYLFFFIHFVLLTRGEKILKNATHFSCKHSLSYIGASWDFINLPQTLLTATSQTP